MVAQGNLFAFAWNKFSKMKIQVIFGNACEILVDGTMRIYNGHRFEIGIFNPRDDQAGWYRGLKMLISSRCPIIDSFSCRPSPFTINLNAFLQLI